MKIENENLKIEINNEYNRKIKINLDYINEIKNKDIIIEEKINIINKLNQNIKNNNTVNHTLLLPPESRKISGFLKGGVIRCGKGIK